MMTDNNNHSKQRRRCACANNSYTKDLGIGIYMRCGLDSYSWYGCFVKDCDCKREGASRK